MWSIFREQLSKKYRDNLYQGIRDLPVGIWFEVHETGNTSLIIKHGFVPDKLVEERWEDIYYQHIRKYGLNESLKEIMSLRRKIAINRARALMNNERHLLNHVRLDEQELQEILSADGADVYQIIVSVEKWLGFSLNLNKCSVDKFYSYLNKLKEDNERQNQRQ